jgi:hypothetical protein
MRTGRPALGLALLLAVLLAACAGTGPSSTPAPSPTPSAALPEDPAEAAAREKALEFAHRLAGLTQLGGSDPYRPDAVRLASRPSTVTDPVYLREPIEWPLESSLATAGTPIVAGSPDAGRCLVVSGIDLGRLWPALAAADGTTPFVSDAGRYSLVVRPLLPDEPAVCP